MVLNLYNINGYLLGSAMRKMKFNTVKMRLIAQDCSQRLAIDYGETYSSVMESTTFHYLISMIAKESLQMRLMYIVTA